MRSDGAETKIATKWGWKDFALQVPIGVAWCLVYFTRSAVLISAAWATLITVATISYARSKMRERRRSLIEQV